MTGGNGNLADSPSRGSAGQIALLERTHDDFDRLRGRLFQLFEAMGMPARQEDAAKGIVRRFTYDMERELQKHLRGGDIAG